MEIVRPGIPYVNVHPVERWASVIGGAALTVAGARRGKAGVPVAALGALMIHRGVTGRSETYRMLGIHTAPANGVIPYELGIRARASVTIQRPRHLVFDFWRQIENLPRFMRHLVSVDLGDGGRSYWVARGPINSKIKWTAEIVNEVHGELLAWKSLPGGDVGNAGSVRFLDAPGNRGTEVRVELQYNLPAGVIGAYVARLFGREPEQQIEADLARLKQLLEGSEVATTEGQSSGTPGHGATVRAGFDEVVA